jgi:hypothetical protein
MATDKSEKNKERTSNLVKEAICDILVKHRKRFDEELDTLTGRPFVEKYLELTKFVIPTMSAQKVDTTMSVPITITLSPVSPKEISDTIPIDQLQDG